MATCQCCRLYDACEKKYEDICRGTRVQDLEHRCIDYLEGDEFIVEVPDEILEQDWSRVNIVTPEQLREILKE